jgi:hypothetical protein
VNQCGVGERRGSRSKNFTPSGQRCRTKGQTRMRALSLDRQRKTGVRPGVAVSCGSCLRHASRFRIPGHVELTLPGLCPVHNHTSLATCPTAFLDFRLSRPNVIIQLAPPFFSFARFTSIFLQTRLIHRHVSPQVIVSQIVSV